MTETTEQRLASVEQKLKDLHEKEVIPMRERRAAFKKLRGQLKTQLRAEKHAEKKKGTDAKEKPAKKNAAKIAAKEEKVATLAKPTASEKEWAARRTQKGNGRTPTKPVTKAKA